ncbi:hypothetical protein D9M68_1003260 [compost metagenome]
MHQNALIRPQQLPQTEPRIHPNLLELGIWDRDISNGQVEPEHVPGLNFQTEMLGLHPF